MRKRAIVHTFLLILNDTYQTNGPKGLSIRSDRYKPCKCGPSTDAKNDITNQNTLFPLWQTWNTNLTVTQWHLMYTTRSLLFRNRIRTMVSPNERCTKEPVMHKISHFEDPDYPNLKLVLLLSVVVILIQMTVSDLWRIRDRHHQHHSWLWFE